MKIICLHQSADLYGSDRSFLQVVKFLKSSEKFDEICVVLPRYGELSGELEAIGVEITYMQLSLLSKTYLKKLQFHKIVFPLLQAFTKYNFFSKYDIVYCNTSVILDYYFIAPFIKKKKIIHVREIPVGWLGKILTKLIKNVKGMTIFNSYATKRSFGNVGSSVVIHNAFEGFENNSATLLTKTTSKRLNILLIGRINSWKGQEFVIEALSKLQHRNYLLNIVGDTSTGNEDLLISLKKKIEDAGLNDQVTFTNFVKDTVGVYRWCDVVLVPSIKPEPFGRIAIEAMSVGKPVIGAKHGGLIEIIEENQNGLLFEPNNINDFLRCVQSYIDSPSLVEKHATAALNTYHEKFSMISFHKKLHKIFYTNNT